MDGEKKQKFLEIKIEIAIDEPRAMHRAHSHGFKRCKWIELKGKTHAHQRLIS